MRLLEKLGYEYIIISEKLKDNVAREKHFFFFHKEKHENLKRNF